MAFFPTEARRPRACRGPDYGQSVNVPVCWYLLEGTPGQRLLRLRIVRASDGERIGIGRILLRYLVWAFCLWAFCIPAVIAAVVANDHPQKRAWTDLAGDSVVVRTL